MKRMVTCLLHGGIIDRVRKCPRCATGGRDTLAVTPSHDKLLYNPVKAYNATVFYNRSNGNMTRVVFTRKFRTPEWRSLRAESTRSMSLAQVGSLHSLAPTRRTRCRKRT